MTTIRLRRFAYVWLIALLSITAEVGPPAAAQTPLLPYATLRTVPQLHGEVWPADLTRTASPIWRAGPTTSAIRTARTDPHLPRQWRRHLSGASDVPHDRRRARRGRPQP